MSPMVVKKDQVKILWDFQTNSQWLTNRTMLVGWQTVEEGLSDRSSYTKLEQHQEEEKLEKTATTTHSCKYLIRQSNGNNLHMIKMT